jgi:hypothetical protein
VRLTGAPLRGPRLVSTVVLVAVAAVLLATLVGATGSGRLAADFHASYLDAAESVRESGTPWSADAEFPYWYPPLLAELVVPLTFIPQDVAAFIAFLASLLALLSTVYVVGVRDIRCYAAVLIWAPGWNSLELANVTVASALVAALVWRYRDTTWTAPVALGSALAVKLLLWPLVVWLAATQRMRSAALSLCVGVGLTVASWAAIGFSGFTSYADRLQDVPYERSFSFLGMAAALGLGPTTGRVATVVCGVAFLGAVVHLARKGDEVRAFTCAIVAALAFAPVVWLHYLVLLVVPIAIARPRFSAIWLLPIVLWVCPRDGHGEGLQPFLPAVVVLLILATLVAWPSLSGEAAEAPA